MVELLDPGTEAETCLMAGRGMNGLRGVVVCYNPHNQRYTLELEEGDMMSLRIRNVRRIAAPGKGSDGGGPNRSCDDDAKPASTTPGRDGGTATSSLPGNFAAEAKADFDEGDGGRDAPANRPVPLLEAISPVNAILIALVAYFFLKSNSAPDFQHYHINYSHYSFNEVSTPVLITLAVLSYLVWEWGTKPGHRPRGDFKLANLQLRVSNCDFWEIVGISGLVLWSLEVPTHAIVGAATLVFFVWKFGTRNGRTRFGWDNVKEKMANLNVWEALMLARVAQNGLGALNHMARPRRR